MILYQIVSSLKLQKDVAPTPWTGAWVLWLLYGSLEWVWNIGLIIACGEVYQKNTNCHQGGGIVVSGGRRGFSFGVTRHAGEKSGLDWRHESVAKTWLDH